MKGGTPRAPSRFVHAVRAIKPSFLPCVCVCVRMNKKKTYSAVCWSGQRRAAIERGLFSVRARALRVGRGGVCCKARGERPCGCALCGCVCACVCVWWVWWRGARSYSRKKERVTVECCEHSRRASHFHHHPAPQHTPPQRRTASLPTPHTQHEPIPKAMAAPHPPPPSPSATALTAPLSIVDALFASAGRPTVDGDWGVASYFASVAADPVLAAQVSGVDLAGVDGWIDASTCETGGAGQRKLMARR